MATISPFRAWRYNPEHVQVQQVVTQPYDKISPSMQERYYQASPYNLVRIILGKRQPEDNNAENVYSRAASAFQNWRQTGILRRDPAPSIYRYTQTFLVPGTSAQAERRGFIALGRIEEYSKNIVFRHEQTLAKPKADRLDLLRATRAHFGQLFMIYSGAGQVQSILDSAVAPVQSSQTPPDIEVTDEYDVAHRVWKLSDASTIASVQAQMKDHKLVIADGHHRYETALTYRNERRATAETGSGLPAPYDSVMMTFVDMDLPGLVILPTHRAIFGLPSFSSAHFYTEAQKFFTVQAVEASPDPARAAAILRSSGYAGTALLAVTPDRTFLLHTPKALGTPLFGKLSPRQQALDVVQLHKCLLEGVLKISEDTIRNQQNVAYYRDAAEALSEVRAGNVQVAFLMNPARTDQVRDVALAGEVLPQKSTDFYPKLLSGLTIYALE